MSILIIFNYFNKAIIPATMLFAYCLLIMVLYGLKSLLLLQGYFTSTVLFKYHEKETDKTHCGFLNSYPMISAINMSLVKEALLSGLDALSELLYSERWAESLEGSRKSLLLAIKENQTKRDSGLPPGKLPCLVSGFPPNYKEINTDCTIHNNALQYELKSLKIRFKLCQENLFKKNSELECCKSNIKNLASKIIELEKINTQKSDHLVRFHEIIKLQKQHIKQERRAKADLDTKIKRMENNYKFKEGFFKSEVLRLKSNNPQLREKLASSTSNDAILSSQPEAITTALGFRRSSINSSLSQASGYQVTFNLSRNLIWLQKRS